MRKTKVIGFSVPPEIHNKFLEALKNKHKTKSEFFREVLDAYFYAGNKKQASASFEADVSQVLRTYWDIRATIKSEVIIIGLALIENKGQVLIGLRGKKDKHVENLSWVFPGGRMKSLDFASELTNMVKKETNLKIKVQSLIEARVHPDTGLKNVQIIALYFHCILKKENLKEKPSGGLARLRWVQPFNVFKYFTSSVSDDVTKLLSVISKSK